MLLLSLMVVLPPPSSSSLACGSQDAPCYPWPNQRRTMDRLIINDGDKEADFAAAMAHGFPKVEAVISVKFYFSTRYQLMTNNVTDNVSNFYQLCCTVYHALCITSYS